MTMGIENPLHILFIAAVALVVLGPKRLPDVARSLGRGVRELREAMSSGLSAGGTEQPVHSPAPAPVAGEPVDPPKPVRSGDAPDRRPL